MFFNIDYYVKKHKNIDAIYILLLPLQSEIQIIVWIITVKVKLKFPEHWTGWTQKLQLNLMNMASLSLVVYMKF
jgi:hypothetical protein